MKLNHLIIIGALCGALLIPSSASSWGVVGLSAGGGGVVPFERISYEFFNPGADPYAASVTIPADCTFIVLGIGSYRSGGSTVDTANLNGSQNFTIVQDYTASGNSNMGLAYLASPASTGSQTINIGWAAEPTQSLLYVIYYKGVSGVGDSDKNITNTDITLDTAVGDTVLSIAFGDGGISWTGTTEVDEDTGDGYISFAEHVADATTETFKAAGAYAVFCSMVLQPN